MAVVLGGGFLEGFPHWSLIGIQLFNCVITNKWLRTKIEAQWERAGGVAEIMKHAQFALVYVKPLTAKDFHTLCRDS